MNLLGLSEQPGVNEAKSSYCLLQSKNHEKKTMTFNRMSHILKNTEPWLELRRPIELIGFSYVLTCHSAIEIQQLPYLGEQLDIGQEVEGVVIVLHENRHSTAWITFFHNEKLSTAVTQEKFSFVYLFIHLHSFFRPASGTQSCSQKIITEYIPIEGAEDGGKEILQNINKLRWHYKKTTKAG